MEQKEFQNGVQRILNEVHAKVEEVHRTVQIFGGKATREGFYGTSAGMTPLLLLQTIQKMIEENELLKKEVMDKSEKIDTLRFNFLCYLPGLSEGRCFLTTIFMISREQITVLHSKNDSFIDQHNKIQEQRADTLKESAELARRNLMVVREQKAKLEEEFNEVLHQLNEAKRELLQLRKTSEETNEQREKLEDELERVKGENSLYKNKQFALEEQVKDLTTEIKEEKLAKRQAQNNNNALREELADKTETIAGLEKKLEERKKKIDEVRRELESNFEEEKKGLEAALKKAKAALQKERDNQAEELNKRLERSDTEWAEKLRKREQELADHHAREIQALRAKAADEERKAYERGQNDATSSTAPGLAEAEKRSYEAGRAEGDHAGYERGRAEGFEAGWTEGDRIGYERGLREINEKREGQSASLQEQYAKGFEAGRLEGLAQAPPASSTPDTTAQLEHLKQENARKLRELRQKAKEDMMGNIKKIMNEIFFSLKADFEEEEEYSGTSTLCYSCRFYPLLLISIFFALFR